MYSLDKSFCRLHDLPPRSLFGTRKPTGTREKSAMQVGGVVRSAVSMSVAAVVLVANATLYQRWV